MNFHVMTLFPDIINSYVNESIVGRAIKNGIINVNAVDIRNFSKDKHKKVDDYPYGGGAGLLMQAQPVYDAYNDICRKNFLSKPRLIYVTPWGHRFDQKMAVDFSKENDLIFLCGHYEGIDERVLDLIATDFISIGDYVLTGGELPSLVMIDTISRMIPGVLGNEVSKETESFSGNLLEYPQYTRPEEFMGMKVPEVLLSGHHQNIEKWRATEAVRRTEKFRPDLLQKCLQSEKGYDNI